MSKAYDDYLESPEWSLLRKLALDRANHQCERCGAHESLQPHHLTYESLGAESVLDLEVLCETCHREAHAVRNRAKRKLEFHGQNRLFDRWEDPEGVAHHVRKKAA